MRPLTDWTQRVQGHSHLLILLFLSSITVQSQRALTLWPDQSRTLFFQYIQFELGNVFAGRALMAGLLSWLNNTLPLDPFSINTLIQFGFVFAGLLAIQRLGGLAACFLAAALLHFGFLPLGYGISYPYDLPALSFAALMLYCLVKGKRWPLALLLVFGTVNKETTLWAVAAAFALAIRSRHFRFPALLLTIWVIVYAATRYLVSQQLLTVSIHHVDPSGSVLRITSNVQELLLLGRGGVTDNVHWFFLPLYLCLLNFQRLSFEWRAMLAAGLVAQIPLLIFGNIWELRIFNDLTPLVAISSTQIIAKSNDAAERNPAAPNGS